MSKMSKKGPWQIYGDKRKRTINKWYKVNGTQHICWLCGLPLSKDEITFDHIAGQKEWPEYAFEQSNLRPAHLYCNQQRGRKGNPI